MSAAAATAVVIVAEKKYDERNDDNPCAVVVKKIAEAVVVHMISPFERDLLPLDTILCIRNKIVTAIF